MLIDDTYFVGEILIAGLGYPPVQEALGTFIAKREPEYLKAVLGYGFYKVFSSGINNGQPEDRWNDLVNGSDYTDKCGMLREWTGLVNDGKQSPIANYVYYWFQRDNVTFTSTVGEMEGQSENATSVSPAYKMCRAYNEMVDQTEVLHDFLMNKKDGDGNLVYPEFKIKESECFQKINMFNI
jgi:hypothetical protein